MHAFVILGEPIRPRGGLLFHCAPSEFVSQRIFKVTRSGRPSHEPTDETRNLVESLSGFGIPQAEIARLVGIDPKILRFHYADQIERGAIKASAKVAQNLFTMACKPTREGLSAAIFWLKVRAGWSEYAPKSPSEGPLGKKEAAERDALTAGDGNEWTRRSGRPARHCACERSSRMEPVLPHVVARPRRQASSGPPPSQARLSGPHGASSPPKRSLSPFVTRPRTGCFLEVLARGKNSLREPPCGCRPKKPQGSKAPRPARRLLRPANTARLGQGAGKRPPVPDAPPD
jgi:hypothetical protein